MTRRGARRARLAAPILLAACAGAFGCAEILSELVTDPADASSPSDGLREALRVGTGRAVDGLARVDGYLASPDVRIPVPDKLARVESGLRTIGAGSIVDEFVTSVNRAAEAAAPLARDVFVDTIRGMTFADALAILRGEQHEATDYLRANAGPRLAELFRPIIVDKLDSVGATRELSRLVDRARRLPLVEMPELDLPDYVTEQALDGLFRRIGDEEERIRRDPAARTTELLKKYFGQSAGS